MGPTQLLVSIFDARIVNEVLEKAKDRVPTSQMALQLAFGKGSLFFAPFSKVERQCAMYDREINGNLLAEVHAISHKVIQKLDLWAKRGQDGNWETDSNSCSQNLAFAVLGISIFGEGYVDWAVARKFEKLLVSIADEIPGWIHYTMPPVWRLSFIRFWRKCDKLKHSTESLVTEAQKVQNAVSSNLVNKKILGEGRVGAMMYHGGFTTAGILSGVLTQLAHHPEIQAKVYAEVEEVCGSNMAPSQSDVKQMHYLMACVHESARLLPSAPFLQRCSLQSDLKLGPGLIVPAGAILAAPVHLIQLDPVYWGNDSTNFNPDRFLKPKSKCLLNAEESPCIQNECDQTQKDATMSEKRIFQAPALDSGFLTFGAGARSCIGSNFALTEIASLIMALIQRYELKLVQESPKDLTPKLEHGVLQYSPSTRLILIPRIAHN
ncbi:hypothetical protein BDL97_01G082400 [Sphagnum fallax]|nr:hypothetical protein BDL97_01G082400 [Sphagnum fallax]